MISTYELYKTGMLDDLIKKGLIISDVPKACGIYQDFKYRRDLGDTYYDAIGFVADKYCVSERTARRMVKLAAT
jgi:hypothetical protein